MKRITIIMILVLLTTVVAQGQIKIGGNVYGGGNQGKVEGSTKVTVRQGDLNKVFGGARMANVGGNAYVNIDGKKANSNDSLNYMVINHVYGGNDIAGTIGTAKAVGESLPAELKGNTDGVDSTWNAYVHLSTKVDNSGEAASDAKKIFIGQVFAGGNGDYYYDQVPGPGDGKLTHNIYLKEGDAKPIASKVTNVDEEGFNRPELDKTYLDVQGGTIFFAHGGGNNATVKEKAVIHVDNPSTVVTQIYVNKDSRKEVAKASATDSLLTDNRIQEAMGIRMAQEHVESDEFQIGRLFGGNNKAEMAIQPKWNLQRGAIRNLYSGGNRGAMTCPEGLLLEIDPKVPDGLTYEQEQAIKKKLVIDNVYGGCRMADVMPTVDGAYKPCANLQYKDKSGNLIYKFPNGLSARVLIRGGDINNVYGGNDVTGRVWGGNAIGVYTSIRGDVYGGGNGAYAYTDNEYLANDETYGDYYYTQEGYATSIDALNAFRPNAEQVSIRLKGTDAAHPTIIGGSVFCGGNCATLKTTMDENDAMMEVKIGSYVIANRVFLGNNGAGMIDEDILKHYAGAVDVGGGFNFSTLKTMKTDASLFASYMEGVALDLHPSIVFDSRANGDPDDYKDYTSKIGSFFCGGNVGSMTSSGVTSFKFDRGLIIYDKLVGGCNDANVPEGPYNAAYEGGILGTKDEQEEGSYMESKEGKMMMKDRIELRLENVVIEPRRWNDTFTEITAADLSGNKLKAGQEYYTTNLRSSRFIADGTEVVDLSANDKYYKLTTRGSSLDWNTVLWNVNENDFMVTDSTTTANDENRRLLGGNVYGGCYNSGHVNGNVVININQDLIKKDVVFAQTDGVDEYTIKGARRSGVLCEAQGDDVMAVAMTVFGAGYGEDSEIWGSTTVNLNNGYTFQVFGGGEEGVVGKKNSAGKYVYNAAYSTTVNLKGPNAGYAKDATGGSLAEAEYIYGGGSEGDVCGDTHVYLGDGRVYDAFGGASNADIYGGAEVHIGHEGFPWIRNNVYGGNDFGGTIRGNINHTTATARSVFDTQILRSATYVKYIQGRVDSIFGGSYGHYDYADPIFQDYTYSRGEEDIPSSLNPGAPRLDKNNEPVFSFPNLVDNSFVHFIPADNGNNHVEYIFGGSEGYPGNVSLNNTMQTESYVLVDDTKTKEGNRFANVDIYGGGAFAGTGMLDALGNPLLGAGRTAVDLFAGSFHNVYGGCNQEGLVGYTRVNVPSGSTINVNALFGGGKGYDITLFNTKPALAARYCDHYVTCIDYQSENAIVNDAIYGGNENCRIACDTYINIKAPVMQSNGYQATVYGAGYGRKTVSGRTNVYMNNNSNAYKVFGGGRDGNAFNFASLTRWLGNQFAQDYVIADGATDEEKAAAAAAAATAAPGKVKEYGKLLMGFKNYISDNPVILPTSLPSYNDNIFSIVDNGIDGKELVDTKEYYNTNVHIMNGGNVSGYAYGGGLGTNAVVAGSTYLELKGGNVDRDIYGGGQGGPVFDEFGLGTNVFTATTNVYIEGGMARNVYGGGYLGHVGKHCKTVAGEIVEAAIHEPYTGDIPAIANVIIGKTDGSSFTNGIPAIQRNVYGGGEGGSVYGTANLTINNGYIGYRYKNTATSGASKYEYVEELDDQKPNAIELAGNAFGGGYVVNSYVDKTNVEMYGGTIRGSLYGGGEVGPIGRGTIRYKDTYNTTGLVNGDARIYKAGKTHVKMYDGHVLRNVFGGGRGKDSWGGDGTMYMDEALKPTLDLKCKGYVFGQTVVDIYGGEIGTDEGVAQGYGNVFGGGDIGCVYSAYELGNGTLCMGKKPDNSKRYDDADEGYYYKYENNSFVNVSSEKVLTEDCKVLVEPWCKATANVTINDSTYAAGSYVPTDSLNYLGNKQDAKWNSLGKTDVNKEGIIIHNAVFAGGNTSPGSTEVYANTTTVFGNATASVHDVYNRDLISIGRGRVGGLYGDGNLTLVDGYRELNITNYGTDYYHINPEITLAVYNALPLREAAYYEIRYKCLIQCTDKNGKTYAVGSTITADEMQTVFEGVTIGGQSMIQSNGKPLPNYWEENGVCSRYAGRPMNTIQRADFCGVFGSRMVMMGAQDRVPETVDYTNYTINRVRELSLNKKVSVRSGDAGDAKNKEHGNYFGIYSVVNYLGALTSDVDFHNAVRVTDNTNTGTYQCAAGGNNYGTATYYNWKEAFKDDRRRNNGNSHNKVALASGVYLELTSEKSTGKDLDKKDWGLITGVVELDLINVQPGMGGGYVYAKNEHGTRSSSGKDQTILTELNKNTATGERAVTNKKFIYTNTSTDTQKEWETSGNFVHSTETIIDDCYNIGGKYKVGENPVPAHYWFIKGAIYVYDQYISAYTGSPNAFSETVSIPLTITSASHGKMTLLNVQPNRYAYYSVNTGSTKTPLGEDDNIVLRDVSYGRNDAISYWDYNQLTEAEKNLFVEDTYVVIADCTLDGVPYAAGTVLLPSEYKALKASAPTVHHVSRNEDVDFDYVFRPSNNVSHNTGYILTYTIDNPNQWNTWYTPKTGASSTGKKDSEEIKTLTLSAYEDGPTYTPTTTRLYGQNDYKVGNIIAKDIYDTYQDVVKNHSDAIPSTTDPKNPSYQAKFYPAFIVTSDVLETTKGSGDNALPQLLHKGATLAKEDYTNAYWTAMSGSIDSAYVVTNTIQLSKTDFIYRNTYISKTEKTKLMTDNPSLASLINKTVVPAYYCTAAGKYGGNYYVAGNNYRALSAFTAMSESDRANFTFNYDALDLLIDPNYSKDSTTHNVIHAEGQKYQYDSSAATLAGAQGNRATYSLQTPIDYSAKYIGDTPITYKADNGSDVSTSTRDSLSRTEYERLPNEQYYYAPITVNNASDTCYVVKETIVLGDTPYAGGQVISSETYRGLSDRDRQKVDKLKFSSSGTYYYCREGYTINTSLYTGDLTGAVTSVNGIGNGTTYSSTVPTGIVISQDNYKNLINKQSNFSIHGLAPTETSSLYVAGGSDIFDLSAEKIITVIYQYDYVESDVSGSHITPVSERHILNIHLNFKSGIPTVEDIQAPDIVLPGTTISIPEPYVTPGAYEITGGGWKLFDTKTDAESHINGIEYNPATDPLYLYQNKHYLAYYAKTYLGETFSNYVPVSVANYHDLKKVMDAKEHHYYIDHKDVIDKVMPKIYINDYSGSSQNGLDLFKNLFDLSLITSTTTGITVAGDSITNTGHKLKGHHLLNERIKGGNHLEFFLRTDLSHTDTATPNEWTPIGTDDVCFKGTLHGDGHTISGLDNSLFYNLCGEVYNLGVTGSFYTAGVADKDTKKEGYVESCWVKSSTTSLPGGVSKMNAVFGNPIDDEGYQVVNSYFWDGNKDLYNITTTNDTITSGGARGKARAMTSREFYNGTVAYNLNNFYLHKRYSDKKVTSGSDSYQYFTINSENKLTLQPAKFYANSPEFCSSGFTPANAEMPMYVEDRFRDGDFRYAGGTIPEEADERQYVNPANKNDVYFFPIWPDDYLFFGQKLTYGYAVEEHQDVPTAIVRSDGRLSQNTDANRVYRAPAYFRNSTMDVAYFNQKAYLAQRKSTQKDGKAKPEYADSLAYPYMTAINFAGHNDAAYDYGRHDGKWFYPPLLDDGGLQSIVNCDETQNLVVYAPAEDTNKATYDVLNKYFTEPVYNDYYDDSKRYSLVKDAINKASSVYGHLVQNDKKATNDHLLVDKQDFDAPIAYDFDDSHRMWYQRKPDDQEYVDITKGWQGISLPFTAELVTTNDKGEITHFYGGSDVSDKGTKKGHEYWLREFNDIEETTGETTVAKATFDYPTATGVIKNVTNHFLWEYYYKNTAVHNQLDKNSDTYKTYYDYDRSYTDYPLLTGGTPYLLGLPGKTYYEFDLSGNFEAENTAVAIPKLGKQTITFVSAPGATINVSDNEKGGVMHSYNNTAYRFKPNYLNETIEANNSIYTLNADGSSYDKVEATTKVYPFRPYFTSGSANSRTRNIVFSNKQSDMKGEEEHGDPRDAGAGTLLIYANNGVIVVESSLSYNTDVRIVTPAGITVSTFNIKSGETMRVRADVSGLYIVRTEDGRYMKKVTVKKLEK